MSNLYESGEKISTGVHGNHSYVFASGDPVPDAGQSNYVFESGTGLGGKGIYVGGDLGAYETSKTHSDFYGYDGSANPHAQGLDSAGVDVKNPQKTLYYGLHYSTGSGTYGLFVWYWSTVDDTDQYELETTYVGLQDYLDSGLVQLDDPDASGDSTGTDGDGNPYQRNYWTWGAAGDGAMWELSGTGFTVEMKLERNPNSGTNPDPEVAPAEMVGVGPNGTNAISWPGFGETVVLEVRAV